MSPRFALGCARLCEPYVTRDNVRRAVDEAFTGDRPEFDTAPQYGLGDSESALGDALAGRPRSSFRVSTKVGKVIDHDGSRPAVARADTPSGVRRSLEESLARLGLDAVDQLLYHDPDKAAADIASAYAELVRMRDEGVVAKIGLGVNWPSAAAHIIESAPVDVVLLAGRWTLLDGSGGPFLRRCAQLGISVSAAGVFNSGILADPHGSEPSYNYSPAGASVIERAQRIDAVCRRHGVPMKSAALHFPLLHPAVGSVVVGARSALEVRENIDLMDVDIPVDLWMELRDLQLIPDWEDS